MPIDLSTRSLDRFDPVPLYRQLADRVREAIADRELAPGDALPAEGAMADSVGISRTAVREAMDVLTSEGLIVRRSGSASRVVEQPPMRRMDASRYVEELRLLRGGGQHPRTSAFVADHGVDWSAYDVDCDYIEEPATPADADRLAVDVGTPILRRRLVKYVSGVPMQLQRSAVPYDLADGTLLEDPGVQPYPGGTIAELYAAGLVITSVAEDVWTRMPSADERRQLKLEALGPVWDIVRTFRAGDQPVEASRVVAQGSRQTLHYEIDLSVAD